METTTRLIGDLLRDWRHRRRLRQLDLASDAGISQRHLSFLESGRSAPSREMILRLAEQLAVPRELITKTGVLAFISTTTVFGTPVDISLSELAIESFFPANEATAAALLPLAETASESDLPAMSAGK